MGEFLSAVDLNATLKGVDGSVAVGGQFTCAIVKGGVKCWGYNSQGQLGYSDRSQRGENQRHMGKYLPTVDLGSDGREALAIALRTDGACALLVLSPGWRNDRTI